MSNDISCHEVIGNQTVNSQNVTVGFLLKQAFTAHKMKVKELESEVEKYKELANEVCKKESLELQRYKDLYNSLQNKIRQQNIKICKLERKTEFQQKKNVATQVFIYESKPRSTNVSTQVDLIYKENDNNSPERKKCKTKTTESIPRSIFNVEEEIFLVPESVPSETLLSQRELFVNKAIPETEFQDYSLCEVLEKDKNHNKENNLDTTRLKAIPEHFSPSIIENLVKNSNSENLQGPREIINSGNHGNKIKQLAKTNNSPSLETHGFSSATDKDNSELIVPRDVLFKKRIVSKLSRKERTRSVSTIGLKQEASPNVFSSPEVVRVKEEVLDSEFEMTMLPEEYLLLKKNKTEKIVDACVQQSCFGKESDSNLDVKVNVINSFDQVVRVDDKASLNYKYKDKPVRKQIDRQRLNGYECLECAKYFADLPEEERKQKLKACSKHRATHPPPPSTPEHYWEIGFPDSPELIARGYIKETQVVPLQTLRKRPLKMIN